MKKLFTLCAALLAVASALASTNAVHFSASSLPGAPGEYNCAWFSTNNANVAAMLALVTNNSGINPPSAGPTWDFSQLQQASETVVRTDIIDPADGMDGGDFSDAAYAEQQSSVITGVTNQIGWSYYTITNTGRITYGTYTPGTDFDGLAQYDPPIAEIPATITNGQSWTLTTAWDSTLDGFYGIETALSETCVADAYGILILPGLGTAPAWRVHETDGFTLTEVVFGYAAPLGTVTNQLYYWLVPGLGVAVQVAQYGNNAMSPGTLPFTNSVQRIYYASYFTNTPPATAVTTGNLHIQLVSGSARLSWNPFTNSPTSYQVQANAALNTTNWQLLGSTSSTNWTDALSPTQRFYRVLGSP